MITALSIPCMAREPSSLDCPGPLCAGGTPERLWFLVVARKLVIKVTAGKDEPQRGNQAFTVAATASARGVPGSLWLARAGGGVPLASRAEELSPPPLPAPRRPVPPRASPRY